MDWVEPESFWLACPLLADELVGCEVFEGLEAAAVVVGGDEVIEVPPQLVVVVVLAKNARRSARRPPCAGRARRILPALVAQGFANFLKKKP